MPTPTHRSRHLDHEALVDGWLQIISTHHHAPLLDVHKDPARGLDLVLFDMDGTLVDGVSSWEMVHHHFGVTNDTNWQRYSRGEITDEEFVRSDIELWRAGDHRIHVEEIDEILKREMTLMPGARECVDTIRDMGITTGILSGGLDILARRVAVELGIDLYVANGLRLDPEGFLKGEGLTFVKINDKATTTRDILRVLDVDALRTSAVGNSEYDVGMFREVGHSVAVNPFDQKVRDGAAQVVEGKDLRDVLAHMLAYERSNRPS